MSIENQPIGIEKIFPKKTERKIVKEQISPNITADTEKNLSESQENLFPKKSLQEINVSLPEAQILAKKVLWVNEISSLPWTQNKIKEFQKRNWLTPEDGRVWAETYTKMLEVSEKSIALVENAKKDFNESGLSNETLKEISDLIPHMMIQSKEYRSLMYLVWLFQNNSKFKKDAESRDLLIKITGTYEEDKKVVEKSEEAQSVYQIWKDIKNWKISIKEWFEKIITDPTLLMVWGLLFLFGVIGWDTKYTDSFMKRIWWIMWISIFGQAAWNKLGLGEMVDDGGKLWKEVYENIDNAAETSKPKVKEFFEQDFSKMFSDVWTYFSDVWSDISSKYTNLTNWFSSYNEKFKWEDWKTNKEWFIEEKPLIALSWLMSDEKFLNTPKDDLLKIQTKTKLNWYITDETKTKLNQAWVSDKDIANFISKHLKNAFDSEKDATLAKDLLFTSSMKDELYAKIASNTEYVKNSDLNKEIKDQISILINSTDSKKKNLWTQLAFAIKSGKIEDFKIDNFTWIDTTIKNQIEILLVKIKNYNEAQKEINSKIEEIKKIEATDTKNIQKVTLEEYLVILNAITLDTEKIHGLDTSEFDNAKTLKRKDIFELAKNASITTLTVTGIEIKVNDELEKEKKAKELIDDKKTLEELKIAEAPKNTATPKEFKKYFDDNKEKFETLALLLKKYKKSWNELTKITLEESKKVETFKTNYETVRAEYVKKISKLREEINQINTNVNQDFDKQKTEIEKKSKEYKEQILDNVLVINVDFKTLRDFFNEINSQAIIIDLESNSFTELDKAFELTEPKVELWSSDLLKNKITDLETNYPITKVKNDLNVTNVTDLNNIVWQLQDNHKKVATFETEQREAKFEEIQTEVIKIRTKFIDLINASTNIDELNKNYKLYTDKVQSWLGTYTNNKNWLLEGWKAFLNIDWADVVKTEYEEKVYEIKLSKKNKEFDKQLTNIGVFDFFKNNKNVLWDYYINGIFIFNDDTSIWSLKQVFLDISKWNKKSDWNEENTNFKKEEPDKYKAREEAIEILSKLETFIKTM